jgi:hypothetical protein
MFIRNEYKNTTAMLPHHFNKWLMYIPRRESSAGGRQVTCQRLCLKPLEKHRGLLSPFSIVLEAETDTGPDPVRIFENDVD